MLRPMRLANDWRVGWAVRMSRFLSSFPATASHMSFGRSVIQVLLVGSLVALVKTVHLLDSEAEHLSRVRVQYRHWPQPRVSLFWMVFFARP